MAKCHKGIPALHARLVVQMASWPRKQTAGRLSGGETLHHLDLKGTSIHPCCLEYQVPIYIILSKQKRCKEMTIKFPSPLCIGLLEGICFLCSNSPLFQRYKFQAASPQHGLGGKSQKLSEIQICTDLLAQSFHFGWILGVEQLNIVEPPPNEQ